MAGTITMPKALLKDLPLGLVKVDEALATMTATNTKRIATHDGVFKRIENIEVVDSIP